MIPHVVSDSREKDLGFPVLVDGPVERPEEPLRTFHRVNPSASLGYLLVSKNGTSAVTTAPDIWKVRVSDPLLHCRIKVPKRLLPHSLGQPGLGVGHPL